VGALALNEGDERRTVCIGTPEVDQHEIVGAGLPQSSSHDGFSGAIHQDTSVYQCFRTNLAASIIAVQ
jgi:hypothetical protein